MPLTQATLDQLAQQYHHNVGRGAVLLAADEWQHKSLKKQLQRTCTANNQCKTMRAMSKAQTLARPLLLLSLKLRSPASYRLWRQTQDKHHPLYTLRHLAQLDLAISQGISAAVFCRVLLRHSNLWVCDRYAPYQLKKQAL